jgi:ABC-2 type transport system permease protein
VLIQLRRDPRTLALLLTVPAVLVTVLYFVFSEQPELFDREAPALLAVFPFISMFLVTSITTLRERTTGTLERLLAMPIGKLDLLVGYLAGFALVAAVQAGLASALALWALGLDVRGGAALVIGIAVLDALLGTALGLFSSAFAATEFQAVQLLPAVVFPQILLSGLFIDRGEMAAVLRYASDLMPLSYAVEGMARVVAQPGWPPGLGVDLLGLAASTVLAVVLGAATLRRQTR